MQTTLLNSEEQSATKYNITNSIAKQQSDMTHINHIVESCPLTALVDDRLLHSADDNVVTRLNDMATKALDIRYSEQFQTITTNLYSIHE